MEIKFNCLYIFFGIYFLPRQLPRLPQRKLRLWHTTLFYFNFEILWKLWNFWNFLKFSNLKKNWPLNLFFFNFIILKFFENFQILRNFLTYRLAKSNFCAIKKHCTLVPRNFIHWLCTRVQYDYLLHRNCFLVINMLKNGMSRVLLLADRKTVK
jgi:hypothetical protein